ncbi:MAG: SLC13 family permease [Candidatus Polarisedimenticolia bacterium]
MFQAPGWLLFAIIAATLVGVAVGSCPRLRMNRATIALAGGAALVVGGGIGFEAALRAVDLGTLALLFAMMIVAANLRLAGFFQLAARWAARRARTPRRLLALVILLSGLLSALFLNDTVVLMFTPLVLELCVALERRPAPYLIGLAAAANIGSAATITGNPQNILIGVSSKIPYLRFAAALAPVAAVGLVAAWGTIVLLYRAEFRGGPFAARAELRARPLRPTLYKSLGATALMLAGFVAGVPTPLAALAAAALLVVTRRLKPERVFREVDWSLLVFFAGLFVVTGAIESTGLSARLFAAALPLAESGALPFSAVTAALSNVVSNVPAVMLFRPLVPGFPCPERSWLLLAMASTFAGNLTLLGSVANLIVAESARARGFKLSFVEYLKAGVPITVVTTVLGALWLSLR